jgi:hypothetical protein
MPATVTSVPSKPAKKGRILPILIPGPRKVPEPSKRALAKLKKKADHAAKGHREMQALHVKAGATAMAAEHATAAEDYEKKAGEYAAQMRTARP